MKQLESTPHIPTPEVESLNIDFFLNTLYTCQLKVYRAFIKKGL